MMTKRLRVLLLAGVAVLSLAAFYGCGGNDNSTTDSSTDSYSSSDTDDEDTDSYSSSDTDDEDTTSDSSTSSSSSAGTTSDADAA